MNEQLNQQELNELALLGSTDNSGEISPHSLGTTIVATILYCTTPVWSAISTVSAASVEASVLFSCSGNSKQCG